MGKFKDEKFAKVLMHLTQDLFKLHAISFGGVNEIKFLENDNKLHAELVLIEKLKESNTAIQYLISISKLFKALLLSL